MRSVLRRYFTIQQHVFKFKSAALLKIISVIAFSLAISDTMAQLSIGARAGVNFAAEPFKNYTHVFLARPYLGLLANYRFERPISFQVEMNVSGEGSKVKSTNQVFKDYQTYLNIPLLFQYRFMLSSYIELGPQVGILLAAKSNDSYPYSSGQMTDVKSYYKAVVPGFVLGLGHDFKRSKVGGFGINLRYMRSLSAIDKPGAPLIAGDNVKNRVLFIGITYKWAVTK